ncbi:MAG TPA: FHA domain-containing protein [Acidimicrobiia bacterium]|nr:FHA domain-containing protein [Acidimicrobiia bacterium]
MNLDELSLCARPGETALLARWPGVVLLVGAGGIPKRTDELIDLCHPADAGERPVDGRALSRRIAGWLVETDPDEVPAFCALGQSEDWPTAILHGDVDLIALGDDGRLVLSGRHSPSWVDRVLDAPFRALLLGVADEPSPDELARYDLWAGIVPAGGAVLWAGAGSTGRALAPSPSPRPLAVPLDDDVTTAVPAVRVDEGALEADPGPIPPPPEASPSEERPFVSVSLLDTEPEEVRQPLPIPEAEDPAGPVGFQVLGVRCSRSHFNDPDSRFCAHCGISMVHQTRELSSGPRPPLGFLVFDDGSSYQLDTDYVIGREPGGDAAVTAGRARPLHLDDDQRGVSRVHAEVRLVDWDVQIVDRGSANGTFRWDEATSNWARLTAEHPVVVRPGTQISFGPRRRFVFQSQHEV